MLDDSPVVAKIIKSGADDVLIAENSLLGKDTLDFPLSALVEDIQVVQLKAFLNGQFAKFAHSEQYILISENDNYKQVKLFRKDGRLIANIGAIGRGPGEYFAIYDQYIDEANQRVYLLPWMTSHLLVYDFQGTYLKSIPTPILFSKAIFRINPNQTITFIKLPLESDSKNVIWTQDSTGKMISYKSLNWHIPSSFDHELSSNKNPDYFDFSFTVSGNEKSDTLYHYDISKNVVFKRFAMVFHKRPLSYVYSELLNYYFVTIYKLTYVYGGIQGVPSQYIAIDKASHKGSFVKLRNDYLGGIIVPGSISLMFRDGYFTQIIDPASLKASLEEVRLTNLDMTQEIKDRVDYLMKTISYEDNDYIIYGRLKK